MCRMARKYQISVVAKGDVDDAVRALGRLEKRAGAVSKKVRAGMLLGAAAVAAGITLILKTGFSEIAESQKTMAQTRAVLKSTGAVANVSAKQIGNMATALSLKTGIDDESIQSGQNLLLTFTKIRNETGRGNKIFNQATQAALDMSVALGTDMTSASMLVGKALNDPVKGMAALGRAGVQFTAGQKKTIKALVASGRTMDAQKLILAELKTQTGGSAAAFGKTLPGKIAKAKVAFEEMSGQLTATFLPAITKGITKATAFATSVQKWAASKEGKQTIAELGAVFAKLGTAVKKAGEFLLEHRKAVAGVLVVMASLDLAVKAVKGAMVAYGVITKVIAVATRAWAIATNLMQLGMWALNVAMTANPIGMLVVGIGLATAAFVLLYKNSETFRTAINTGMAEIQALALQVWPSIKAAIEAIFPVVKTLVEVYFAWISTYIGAIWTVASTVFGAIKAIIVTVGPVIAALVTGAMATAREAWALLGSVGAAAWTGIKTAIGFVAAPIITLVTGAMKTGREAWALLGSVGEGAWNGIKGAWNEAVGWFGTLKTNLGKKFEGMWDGIKTAFKSAINGIIGAWNGLEFSIPAVKVAGKTVWDGASIGTPNIPYLATGGNVQRAGAAIVGEAGPELLQLPRGARVTPLSGEQRAAGAGSVTVVQHFHVKNPVEELDAFMRRAAWNARKGIA